MKATTRNVKTNLLVCLLVLYAGATRAGDCDLTVSQTQTNFGTFNRGTLSQAANGSQTDVIGKKSTMVTVICPRPERIALYYRAASSGAGEGYQLGDIAHVTLIASDAQSDGKSVSLAYHQQGGSAPAGNANTLAILPNIGVAPVSDEPITRLTLQLTSIAAVNDINQHVKEQKTLNGSGTLEVVSE